MASVDLKVTADTGDAGVKLRRLADDMDKVGKSTAGIRGPMQHAAKELKNFRDLSDLNADSLLNLAAKGRFTAVAIGAMGGAMAAAAAVTVSWAKELVAASSQLTDLSEQTRISTTGLQELGAVGSLVGLSTTEMANGITQMQRRLGDGSKGTIEALDSIGLSLSKLRALKPEDQFFTIAAAIGKVQDPAKQTSLAFDLMGKTGARLLPVIRSDIDALRQKFQDLGIIIDEDVIRAAEELGDNMTFLGGVWTAFKANAIAPVVAGWRDATATIEDLIIALRRLDFSFKSVSEVMDESNSIIDTFLSNAAKWNPLIRRLDFVVDKFRAVGEAAKLMAGVGLEPPKFTPAGKPAIGPAPSVLIPSVDFGAMDKVRIKQEQEVERQIQKLNAAAKQAAEEWKRFADSVTKQGLQQGMDDLAVKLMRLEREGLIPTTEALHDWGERAAKARQQGATLHPVLKTLADDFTLMQKSQAALKSAQEFLAGVQVPPVSRLEIFTDEQLENLRKFEEGNSQLTATLGDITFGVAGANAETMNWSNALADVAHQFQLLGISGESSLGQILSAGMRLAPMLQAMFKGGWSAGFKTSLIGQKDYAGAATAGIAGIGAVAQATNARTRGQRVAGGALAGAAAGAQIAGPFGAIIGGIAGAITGLIRNPTWAKVAKEVGRNMGVTISDELAKAIAKDVKKLGVDRGTAAQLNLGKIISEGLEQGTPLEKLTKAMRDTFSFLERGQINATQANQVLSDSFGQLAAKMKEMGVVGDKSLVETIQLAERFGLKNKEIQGFVTAEIEKGAGGLKALFDNVIASGDLSAARLNNLGIIGAGMFAKLQAQGIGLVETIRIMGPSIDAAIQAFEKSGTAVTGTFAELVAMRNLVTANAPLIQAAEGLNAVMEAMANTGSLTQESIVALGSEASSLFGQLTAAGFTSNQAFSQIAPTLNNILTQANQWGLVIDENTLGLISQAQAAGALDAAKGPMEQLVGLTERMVFAVEKLAGITAGFGDVAVDAFGRASAAASSFSVPDLGRGGEIPFQGAQHGVDQVVTGPRGFFVEPGVTEHVRITDPGKMTGAGGGGPIIINVYPAAGMDERAIAAAIVQKLRDSGEFRAEIRNAAQNRA